MRAHRQPILTLLLITPVLTELLSNNLAPSVLFNPVVFLFLATVGYGFPVLLLREFACRRKMGLAGLLCLGLVYGIVNEGILAKTFYLATNVPLNTFDNYGRLAGISVPWAVTISVWHAFHALLYPILITYYFFPATREQPWLTGKSCLWLGLVTIAVDSLVFFTRSKERDPGQVHHYVLMILIMVALGWLATRVRATPVLKDEALFSVKPVFAGVGAFVALIFVPIVLSKLKVPVLFFYGYYAVLSGMMIRWISRYPAVPVAVCLLFALGDDIVMVLFGSLGAIRQGSIQKLIADFLFLVAFGLFLYRLRKDGLRGDEKATVSV